MANLTLFSQIISKLDCFKFSKNYRAHLFAKYIAVK
jgi:hypothetical protein